MEVERDALMQQLQAQLKDAVEQVEKEVTVGQVEFSKKNQSIRHDSNLSIQYLH